jgi:hypothetical protein
MVFRQLEFTVGVMPVDIPTMEASGRVVQGAGLPEAIDVARGLRELRNLGYRASGSLG